MVSKNLLVVILQLLYVLFVTPQRTKNDLLEAFRKTNSVKEEKVIQEEPTATASHGQSLVFNTILDRLFPERKTVSETT